MKDDISECLPRFARTGSGSKTGSGWCAFRQIVKNYDELWPVRIVAV